MTHSRFKLPELERFIEDAMVALGFPKKDSHVIAQLMAQADLQGSDGHGIFRLAPYTKRIQAGAINLHPQIKILKEKPAMALVDGDNGMGHLVMKYATELAIQKAKNTGIAWVGSQYSNHAGPASLYAKMALEHDMLGLYFAVGNANHLPAWGGLDMLLSTNPIACAIPAMHEAPVILDMATTVTSYGKVKAKRQRGEMMPEGWMINRDGTPLLDPQHADDGLLLPIGGYKGYGLALIIGMLAGTLNGAALGKDVVDFNHDASTPTNTGQAIMVIDPDAFGEVKEFKERMDSVIQEMRNSERIKGVERIWLPGEQSHQKRIDYARDGIPIPDALAKQLQGLATELGIAPLA